MNEQQCAEAKAWIDRVLPLLNTAFWMDKTVFESYMEAIEIKQGQIMSYNVFSQDEQAILSKRGNGKVFKSGWQSASTGESPDESKSAKWQAGYYAYHETLMKHYPAGYLS